MPRAFVDVTLAELGSLTPKSALIVQAENAHDVLSFTASTSSLPARIREQTPVAVKWGYETADTQTFYGYIHHVEPLFVDGETRMKVVCIGASLPLRSAIQRTWRYQSYDIIVRELAASVYLSADVKPHGVVWPYTVASGNAWDFLLGLAKQIGYILAANGTEIRFLSPAEVFSRGITAAPALSINMFRPIVGLASEGGDRRRSSYGLDPRTGQFYSSTAGKIGAALEITTDVSGSPGEAAAQLVGLIQGNAFPFRADVECEGIPKIVQGSLVYVHGIGIGEEYVGQWYVNQVEHDVQGGEYKNYLQLSRRLRESMPSFTRPGQPVRLRTDPYGEVTGTPPPTVLTNGLWRSGWARRAS